jgi:1,2-diacylglycerol 3-beta-galactosyltransferase
MLFLYLLRRLSWVWSPLSAAPNRASVPDRVGPERRKDPAGRLRTLTAGPDVAPTARRAVFLIADTGGGHRSIAGAVAERLKARDPGLSIDIVDPFSPPRRFRPGRFLDVYGILVRYLPRIWEWMYSSTDSPRKLRPVRAVLSSVFGPNLRELVSSPEVVMVGCFHALTTDLLARTVRDLAPDERPKTFTFICDPVDVHAAWIAEGIEKTLFPSEESFRCATPLLGTTETRIVSGFPIRDGFDSVDPAREQRTARSVLGLPAGVPVVLIAGGGEGGGRLLQQVVGLCTRLPEVHVVAVCGRNRRLAMKLSRVRASFPDRLTVLGWSNQFATLVKASDVVVSKAGPNTITECVTAGVPLVLTSFIPGQEAGNPAWAARMGNCRWAPSVDEMCDAVSESIDLGTTGHDRRRGPVPATAADEVVQALLGTMPFEMPAASNG